MKRRALFLPPCFWRRRAGRAFGGCGGEGVNTLFHSKSYYIFLHFLSILNFFLQYSSFLFKYLSFQYFSFLHLLSLSLFVERMVTFTVYKIIQTVRTYQIKLTNHIFHSPVNPQKKIRPSPAGAVLFFFADLGGNVKLGCKFDLGCFASLVGFCIL